MTRLVLAGLLAIALQDPAPRAAEDVRHPWAGFPGGSTAVIVRRLTEGARTHETRERWTVAQVKGLPEVSTQLWSGERWVTGQASVPHLAPVVPEEGCTKAGEKREELVVGGRKIPCTVTDWAFELRGKGWSGKARIWSGEGVRVPYRELEKDGTDLALFGDVLKVELSLLRGRDAATYSAEITDLGATLKVGDRDVPCVVEVVRLEERREQVAEQWTMKRWLSEDVPGRVVKRVREGTLRGAPVKLEEDVVEFEVKK